MTDPGIVPTSYLPIYVNGKKNKTVPFSDADLCRTPAESAYVEHPEALLDSLNKIGPTNYPYKWYMA